MLRSFLIGLVAGQRGITPLAVIATATRRREVAAELPLQKLMLHPVIAAGTAAFAAAEMAGDKMKTALDRTVPIGLAVRSITAAYAGAALAPRDKRVLGAATRSAPQLPRPMPGLLPASGECAAMDRLRRALSRMRSSSAAGWPSPTLRWSEARADPV